jgi:hypothetical protein
MTNEVTQRTITPAAGKRLIAKALAAHPDVREILKSGTLLIVAGTTNGYVAEEILSHIDQLDGFSRRRFFRGVTLPPSRPTTEMGRIADESDFPGDVVIVKGEWQKGKTIFDVIEDMGSGDIVLKGANALDLVSKRAALFIGHPAAGTIGVTLPAVAGRRVRLILPVGLEKRISGDLDELARTLNAPNARGPRFLPVPGEVFTEIDAICQLTGVEAMLTAGGGVAGAEGSVWLALKGSKDQLKLATQLLAVVAKEPVFDLDSVD